MPKGIRDLFPRSPVPRRLLLTLAAVFVVGAGVAGIGFAHVGARDPLSEPRCSRTAPTACLRSVSVTVDSASTESGLVTTHEIGAQSFTFHQLTLTSPSEASRLHDGQVVAVLSAGPTDVAITPGDGTELRGTEGSASSPTGWLLLAGFCLLMAAIAAALARTASIEALRARGAARDARAGIGTGSD